MCFLLRISPENLLQQQIKTGKLIMSQNAPPHAYLTVEQAQRNLRERFKNAAIETYELDARILTGFALGLDDVGLFTQASRNVTEEEYDILEKTCLVRLKGKPVSRI